MDSATESLVGEIKQLVITPRPLADYRNMFLLSEEDLTAGPSWTAPAARRRSAPRCGPEAEP